MGIDVDQLGKRLKQLRELDGKSLSGLALEADVSKSYLAKLEKGEIENPGLKTLQSVAAALGITLADLIPSTQGGAPAGSEQGGPVAEYEELLAEMPESLKEFLEEKEREGGPLPADVVRSLANIQFRGKKPQKPSDWKFLYDAISRSL